MEIRIQKYQFLVLLMTLWIGSACGQQRKLVRNLTEFKQAVKQAKPGDKIVLANGIWKDAELIFAGKGTAQKPITLTVEQKGKVTLEGQSNLRIAGEYLVVEGLVFKMATLLPKKSLLFAATKPI